MKRTTSRLVMLFALLAPVYLAQAADSNPVPTRIIFKPPQSGAPATRVGGGTRGIGQQATHIQLLASDQTGLTTSASPTLYWYASSPSPHDVEVTVSLGENEPLLEKNIGTIKTAGIQVVRLTDYGIKLTAGQDYTWSIAIVTDPKQRSADIFSSATIRYQAPATPFTSIPQMAAAGYWYDTVAGLIDIKSTQLEDFLQQEGISIASGK